MSNPNVWLVFAGKHLVRVDSITEIAWTHMPTAEDKGRMGLVVTQSAGAEHVFRTFPGRQAVRTDLNLASLLALFAECGAEPPDTVWYVGSGRDEKPSKHTLKLSWKKVLAHQPAGTSGTVT